MTDRNVRGNGRTRVNGTSRRYSEETYPEYNLEGTSRPLGLPEFGSADVAPLAESFYAIGRMDDAPQVRRTSVLMRQIVANLKRPCQTARAFKYGQRALPNGARSPEPDGHY